MVYEWELEKVKDWTTEEIKNRIWMSVDCNQPIEALRMELKLRGEEPIGYHNT